VKDIILSVILMLYAVNVWSYERLFYSVEQRDTFDQALHKPKTKSFPEKANGPLMVKNVPPKMQQKRYSLILNRPNGSVWPPNTSKGYQPFRPSLTLPKQDIRIEWR
jgi:hypothetical protein